MWERGREQERVCLCAPVTEPGSLHIYANTHALARAQTRIYTHVHVCRTAKSTRGRARARDCLCYLFYRRYVLVFCTCAHARTHTHTHTRTHRAERTHGTRSHTHSHTYTGCMDTYNFPPWSIENADAERITRFPYFHEQAGPGRIQDNLDYFTQIEGDDAFWPSQA